MRRKLELLGGGGDLALSAQITHNDLPRTSTTKTGISPCTTLQEAIPFLQYLTKGPQLLWVSISKCYNAGGGGGD